MSLPKEAVLLGCLQLAPHLLEKQLFPPYEVEGGLAGFYGEYSGKRGLFILVKGSCERKFFFWMRGKTLHVFLLPGKCYRCEMSQLLWFPEEDLKGVGGFHRVVLHSKGTTLEIPVNSSNCTHFPACCHHQAMPCVPVEFAQRISPNCQGVVCTSVCLPCVLCDGCEERRTVGCC